MRAVVDFVTFLFIGVPYSHWESDAHESPSLWIGVLAVAGFGLLTSEKPLDAESKAGLLVCFGGSAALLLIALVGG